MTKTIRKNGMPRMKSWLVCALTIALCMMLGCVGLIGCTPQAKETPEPEAPTTRTLVDMTGRTVEIPATIDSVATFGSVGVLNAFMECMGQGDKIVNQMPANFTKNDKWAMQYKFAPQIANGPLLETADGVDIEKVLETAPDLCVTMMPEIAQQLEDNGVACIVLKWDDVEDVKDAVNLVGEAMNVQDRAAEYNKYFDEMVAKAEKLTANLGDEQRRDVIYGDVTTLTNPHVISEWWITAAGGNSVTEKTHKEGSLKYTMEELLAWAPEIILSSNTNLSSLSSDANYSTIPAVQNGEIYYVPTVAHVWGNRTVEQPLTIMWALNKMYPELYSEAELSQDIKYFYKQFFEYEMSDEEVKNIIG